MSERILTLFGEEIIPEQPKAEQKARAKKKVEEKEKKPDEIVADEQEAITEQSIAETEKQELAPELPATDGLPGAGTGETIDEDYTVTPAQPSAEISIEPITPLAWAIPEQVEEIQEKEPAPVTQATEFTEEINDQPTSVTQVDSPTAIAEKIKAIFFL